MKRITQEDNGSDAQPLALGRPLPEEQNRGQCAEDHAAVDDGEKYGAFHHTGEIQVDKIVQRSSDTSRTENNRQEKGCDFFAEQRLFLFFGMLFCKHHVDGREQKGSDKRNNQEHGQFAAVI